MSTGYTPQKTDVFPPLKGSFPLDHRGLCKAPLFEWTVCMKNNKWNNTLCRPQAAAYLRCRAENNLMNPDEVSDLGFTKQEWDQIYVKTVQNEKSESSKSGHL